VRFTGALLAGLFFALHLPFLPPSLEDLDSINFALGVRDFDVARHQPHPPGYPLFIAAAKSVRALGLSEVHALSLVNLLGGAVAVFGALMLFGALDRDRQDDWLAFAPALLVAVCPLLWVTAVRPLSDAAGLGPSLVAQALIVASSTPLALMWGAACAGLAAGIRSQAVWLTVPVLLLAALRVSRKSGSRAFVMPAVGYGVALLVWLVPLVVVSGGPLAYWRAFANQGAEDLSGVAMLATTHNRRLLIVTLQHAFIEPWGYWLTATAVLTLAALGCWQVCRRSQTVFVTLLAAFGPYLVFDLLFQEAITTRYALPLVIPMAYLAGRGLNQLPRTPAALIALCLVAASIVVDDQAAYGYAEMDAPAFRMLGDMKAAASEPGAARPVLAMHRKDDFDMRRPIQWVDQAMPALDRRLPAPPKHEWLELVKYWNEGGRAPVWVVADPPRSDLALVGQRNGRGSFYRWPFAWTALIGGARPNEMDWHVFDRPDWYLGEGWALTPETAGVAREDRRGPGYAPISAWIRRSSSPLTLLLGGRNLLPGGAPAQVHVRLDDALVGAWTAAPGFFLQMLSLPAALGPGDYAHLTIDSDSTELAIEQFDAQPSGNVVFGYGEGWNEQEYNPSTGVLWRWSTDRSVMRVRPEGHRLALTLRGEIEAASSSKVVVRAGGAAVAEFQVERTFSRTVLIPASVFTTPEADVTIETSAWYVPAETRWRSADRRRLGLKLFECRLTPAS
jgi:hypothetical protein